VEIMCVSRQPARPNESAVSAPLQPPKNRLPDPMRLSQTAPTPWPDAAVEDRSQHPGRRRPGPPRAL